MPVYALGDVVPDIHPDAYVHPDATVIGNVTIGAFASIWPQAVLRGDSNLIEVGERSSVQDGSIIHCDPRHPARIGADCVIGHAVHIEAAAIAPRCLVASGAVVLNGAVLDEGSVVGAGAVLTYGFALPARSMALGVPAKVRKDYTVAEDYVDYFVQSYLDKARRFRAELRRID